MTLFTCGLIKYQRFLRLSSFAKCHGITFSVAAPDTEQRLSRFRTMENNPILHDENHIGKFYIIPNSVKNKLFLGGGIPRRLNSLIDVFQEFSLIIRSQTVEILSYLRQMNYDHPALRIVIYGESGTGKTTTLMHILHYGYVSRHILLHIPWVSIWTKRPKEIVDSQYRPGRIDLPVEANVWLHHFKLQNHDLLKELDLRTSKTYTWSIRETTEEGEPLLNIIEHGLNRGIHASDCIAALLREIKLQSKSGKFKTMVIIDGVNAFYAKTNIPRPDKSLVIATDVTMVRAFEKVLRNDWNNAAIVVSVDTIPAEREKAHLIPHTPRTLLGKMGFEVLDPFIPVLMDKYTKKEFDSVVDYYIDRKWLQHKRTHEEEGRKELRFLSGRNPYMLQKIVDPL